MAITPTTITSWSGVATYLANLTDRDGNKYFTQAQYGSNQIKLRTTATGTSKQLCIIHCSEKPYITVYNNSGELGESTDAYAIITIANTKAFHTRNGCCINFYGDDYYRDSILFYIGVGKTESGEVFVCCGSPPTDRRNEAEILSISHIYTAPTLYRDVEHNSVITNQTALYAEPVCTAVNKTDKWYKFYFNKCTQQEKGSGAIILNGKTYYTNTYISILDD